MITKDNFFNETYGAFVKCATPNRKPDYISYMNKKWFYEDLCNHFEEEFTDKYPTYNDWLNSDYPFIISSEYWYTENRVIRRSDHWGSVSTCMFELIGENDKDINTAYCNFSDFKKFKDYRVRDVIIEDWDYHNELEVIEEGEYLVRNKSRAEKEYINKEYHNDILTIII